MSRPSNPSSPRIDWTYSNIPLTYKLDEHHVVNAGRYTFQPYQGPETSVPTRFDKFPAEVAEFDGDGRIDGLEDWGGTGDPASWVSNPWLQDTDRDGISDSIEIGVYGSMTIASFIREAGGGDPIKAEQRLRYHNGSLFQTNPKEADTDGDGIIDERDLNPNGLHAPLFALQLNELVIEDPIDTGAFGHCRYCIEPYFIIGIQTQAGVLTIDTPTIGALPITGPNQPYDLENYLTTELLAGAVTSGGLASQFAAVERNARMGLSLLEDVGRYGSSLPNTESITEVTIAITLGDMDNGRRDPTDILDLNGNAATSDYTFRKTFAFGQSPFSCDLKPKSALGSADGRADGTAGASAWDTDEDASLSFEVIDYLRAPFVQRAMQGYASEDPVLPPAASQALGRVCQTASGG